LASRHNEALENIKNHFRESGYKLSFKLLNAHDYGVAQDRKRLFFVGFREDLNISFEFPTPIKTKKYLKDVIWDLKESALPAINKTYTNMDGCTVFNHEYMTGDFSSMYMSRNRVRAWDEPSFTIQAGGRHAPLHPQAPKMQKVGEDKQAFVGGYEYLYRRLSVRECARIQSFPDTHQFYYKNLTAGYKMVGNAVPPNLAYHLAKKIAQDIQEVLKERRVLANYSHIEKVAIQGLYND
jgi:DNA (cytosine-5)-methyltransferase 1